MKLIDILVQELPKLGGWPDGIDDIEMLSDGTIYFNGDIAPDNYKLTQCSDGWSRLKSAKDYSNAVTREQYEAALAASKTEWDGEGLPPVGVNAEVFFAVDTEPKWHSFLAKFIGENHVIALVGLEEISYKKDELLTSDVKFAPLRSEWDRKLDEITQSILDILNDYDFELVHIRSDQKRIATDIVERIASRMIPHTRID
ncbi:hypothetical protein [Enterobacter hormaechei]|uniref:hypothetical protein n=1 Tax=Enterobacter hormaechei TaxID=158836 RepID=UPI00298A3EBD|nr:hypothetical protein [Enterobacter hormaechei]HBL5177628.1 hypothetical protein [Enterobacter hormaechei]HBL6016585.1 hypothetical protein [Enterobacter hormaechei]HBL6131047.1 hypothetical protein [Enterobacter hormaechei]HBL8997978.1 hypothetical protein [Enterobacter hormaechei]